MGRSALLHSAAYYLRHPMFLLEQLLNTAGLVLPWMLTLCGFGEKRLLRLLEDEGPGMSNSRRAVLVSFLAGVYERRRRYREAEERYLEAARLDGEDFTRWLELAWLLEKMKKPEAAVEAYCKAVSRLPPESAGLRPYIEMEMDKLSRTP